MIADTPRNLANIQGGLEAATINLISGLKDLPVDIHVISIRPNIDKPEDIVIREGCTIHYRPYTFRILKIVEFLWFGRRKISQFVKNLQPDLIHLQGTGPILLMLQGLDKRKVIITQHGIMGEESKYKTSYIIRLKFRIKWLYDKFLLRRYDQYISISYYNRCILESFQKKNSKIFSEIIYNPVNEEFFNTKPPSSLTKIVFVGLVNKLKGVHILLDAMIKLRAKGINYSLDIVGGTKEPGYYRNIKQFIDENGLENQVIMHGWVSQIKVKQLIEDCAVFLLPSLQECLPISIAEAMAAERVVVATNTGGIPEMVTDKVSGFLFTKNDSDELVEILADLYNHNDKIYNVASNAKLQALKMFRPAAVGKQTYDFYKSVLKRHMEDE